MVEDKQELIILNPKTVYKTKLDSYFVELALNFIDKNNFCFSKKEHWDCDVVTTHQFSKNILTQESLLVLKHEVLKCLDDYMIITKKFYNGFIDESWYNIYEKNFFQEFHNHENPIHQHICGVFYLSEENSPIEFFIGDDSTKIKPNKGELIIFDYSFYHRVMMNKKESQRISLAFNFRRCEEV
tara:strand:- start:1290 stop:1841 length:552 start_codon:yes stop_codon:yes gene_type:complete